MIERNNLNNGAFTAEPKPERRDLPSNHDGKASLIEFVRELLVSNLAPSLKVDGLKFLGDGGFSLAFEGNSASHGPIVIKTVNPLGNSRAWTSYEERVAAYKHEFHALELALEGGVICPKPLKVGILDSEHSDGGPAYLVTTKLDGRNFEFPLDANPIVLESLGENLGRLHRIKSGEYDYWEKSKIRPERNRILALNQEFNLGRVKELASRGLLDHEALIYLEQQHELIYKEDHEPTLTHGDLGPQNIKIGANGETQLLDFGLARFLTSGARDIARIKITLLWEGAEGPDSRWNHFLKGYARTNPDGIERAISSIRFEMASLGAESSTWRTLWDPKAQSEYAKRIRRMVERISHGAPLVAV